MKSCVLLNIPFVAQIFVVHIHTIHQLQNRILFRGCTHKKKKKITGDDYQPKGNGF